MEERAELEQHLDDCADCRELVVTLIKGREHGENFLDRSTSEPPDSTTASYRPYRRVQSPPKVALVKPGDVLAEKYRVEQIIGRGGMAVVVLATHLGLHRQVAIKILSSVASEKAIARLQREALMVAQMQSEHIVKIFDVDRLDTGQPYVVMEVLDGHDMRRIVKVRAPLPVGEAVEYVLQACEGVAHAHAHGIIHRDLKPANLFVTLREDGSELVKVLDFGVSKLQPGTSAPGGNVSLTDPQAIVGTPRYMSPEQWLSAREVDPRTDIWSLGIILFMLLTGRAPFEGLKPLLLKRAILSTNPPSLSSLRADVSPGLDEVMQKCLRKKPGERYQSIAEFARALEPFGGDDDGARSARIAEIIQPDRWPEDIQPAPTRDDIPVWSFGSTTPFSPQRRELENEQAVPAGSDTAPTITVSTEDTKPWPAPLNAPEESTTLETPLVAKPTAASAPSTSVTPTESSATAPSASVTKTEPSAITAGAVVRPEPETLQVPVTEELAPQLRPRTVFGRVSFLVLGIVVGAAVASVIAYLISR